LRQSGNFNVILLHINVCHTRGLSVKKNANWSVWGENRQSLVPCFYLFACSLYILEK